VCGCLCIALWEFCGVAANETTPEGRGVGVERLIYSPDDSISLSLEYLEG
jgi:hypothetical protein